MERTTFVQESLSFNQNLARRQDEIVGNTLDSGASAGKGAAKRIARAGVARPTELVAFSIKTHLALSSPPAVGIDSPNWSSARKPASSRTRSPSSIALASLEPAFSPTTT